VNEEELKAKVAELEAKVAQLTEELSSKDATIQSQTEELSSLKEFKSSIEEQALKAQKFAEIKNLFKEAGVEKDETYFDSNKEKLMGLEKEAIAFMLQEMVAFSASLKNPSAESSVKIPPVPAQKSNDLKDPVKLGKMLREFSINKSQ